MRLLLKRKGGTFLQEEVPVEIAVCLCCESLTRFRRREEDSAVSEMLARSPLRERPSTCSLALIVMGLALVSCSDRVLTSSP